MIYLAIAILAAIVVALATILWIGRTSSWGTVLTPTDESAVDICEREEPVTPRLSKRSCEMVARAQALSLVESSPLQGYHFTAEVPGKSPQTCRTMTAEEMTRWKAAAQFQVQSGDR